MLPPAPATRLEVRVDRPVNAAGRYVLYWMTSARRPGWSFALQHAGWHAERLGKPLLVFEPLRLGYAWASHRLHRFVVDGMRANQAAFDAAGVRYLPWVEPERGAGSGLLEALAAEAAVVVTDVFPCFFLPRMLDAAAGRLRTRLEVVDGNGLLPLSASEKAWPTAAAFRRHLQKTLPAHLDTWPVADPLPAIARQGRATLPDLTRWPSAPLDRIAELAYACDVAPVPYRGGAHAAEQAVTGFLDRRLDRYAERSHPDEDVASGLSPYLHFGHASAHRVARGVLDRSDWAPARLGKVTGSRNGWWGVPEDHEGFLDELVTWRELGYAFGTHRRDDLDRYEGLPDWARATLDAHREDRRDKVYPLDAFAAARTHDPVWNAAQRQLVAEGRIHNYLRMLWGKKILEWTATPEDALAVMVELNNRYGVDGRNPNSYSGIGWVLGRFDRPWGPVRPVYGTIRYMSSDNTVRKLRIGEYLRRWS